MEKSSNSLVNRHNHNKHHHIHKRDSGENEPLCRDETGPPDKDDTIEVSVRNSGGTTTKITKDKNGRLLITTEL
jgi:hypothetical protein